MTRRVFYTGFYSNVIDDKWEAFENGFGKLDVNGCVFMTEEHVNGLMQNQDLTQTSRDECLGYDDWELIR